MTYFIICILGFLLCVALLCLTLLAELCDKIRYIKRKVDQWTDKH